MKRKTMKRLVSTALAGTLALSLAAPALAEEESGGWSTEITATYQEIDLAVTVPGEGSAIINPYGLPVTLEDGVSIISDEQITTAATLVITNQSEVDLAVSVNGKVTPTDDVEIKDDGDNVNDPVGGGGEDKDDILKNVLVKFEIFAAPGVDGDDAYNPEIVDPMFAALKGDADVSLTLAEDADDADDTIILKKGDAEGNAQDGSVAFVRLSGEVAKKPTAGWTADDGFTANIIYTFEPDEYSTEIGVTLSTMSAGTWGTPTITVDALPEGTTITTPADQITITVVNNTNSTNVPTAADATWTAGTRVITSSLTAQNSAAQGDEIEVTVRIVDDNGNVYKGVATGTVDA